MLGGEIYSKGILMVSNTAAEIIKEVFKRRFEEIKDDIASGRITFYNAPSVWDEKTLSITALNCVLLQIAQEAKWN